MGDDVDPDVVRRTIQAYAEDVKQRELETAFRRLEARSDLTARRRQVITELATAIVDGILVSPESALEDFSEHHPETVRIAIELFDPDR